jgi:3-oxoacyl-[acyl-carrier protein] reductase
MNSKISLNLSKKSCIVAGGDGSIGLSIALVLQQQGADVSVLDKNISNSDKYPEIFWYKTDLRNIDEMNASLGNIGEERGLDILVHSAGINPVTPLSEISESTWDSVIETNLKSCLFLAKGAYPYMKKQGGSIILVSSITSRVGFSGLSVYGTSKGGINSMVKNLACELAVDKIRVNAVAPGTVKTPMTKAFCWGEEKKLKAHAATIPMDRIAEPEDIADSVLYFASDLSKYVTGQVLYVDGGMTAMQADYIDMGLRRGE